MSMECVLIPRKHGCCYGPEKQRKKGDFYAPSIYFWAHERDFIFHSPWTSSNIIRVTS